MKSISYKYIFILVMLIFVSSCSDTHESYRKYTEAQADKALRLLASNGIEAKSKTAGDGKFRIVYAPQDRHRAERLLSLAVIPDGETTDISSVFGDSGLIETPIQERARLSFGLSEELSSTISQIHGVVDARVHILLPEREPISRELPAASAAVAIQYIENVDVPGLTPEIRQLLSGAVPNLAYNDVSVSFFPVSDQLAEPVNLDTSFKAEFQRFHNSYSYPFLALLAIISAVLFFLRGVIGAGHLNLFGGSNKGDATQVDNE